DARDGGGSGGNEGESYDPFCMPDHRPFRLAAGLALVFGASLAGASPIIVFAMSNRLRRALAISLVALLVAGGLGLAGGALLLAS
ncbi:MAG: hypothetical protein M3Y13_01540, partial [Armatimonadota bacterium]|nr:hypothetical protein [Armatimonadota bacterium]